VKKEESRHRKKLMPSKEKFSIRGAKLFDQRLLLVQVLFGAFCASMGKDLGGREGVSWAKVYLNSRKGQARERRCLMELH